MVLRNGLFVNYFLLNACPNIVVFDSMLTILAYFLASFFINIIYKKKTVPDGTDTVALLFFIF